MSLVNRNARRLAAVLGSACFLGGLTIAAAPVDAAIYASLQPSSINVTGGSQIGSTTGSVYSGYTVTLTPGSVATINYNLVYSISGNGGTSTSGGALFTARGAVIVASTGSASINTTTSLTFNQTHASYGSQTLRSDQVNGKASGGGALFGVSQSNGGNTGLGAQTATFGTYTGSNPALVNDTYRFDIQTAVTNAGGGSVSTPLIQGTSTPLTIGSGVLTVSGSAAGSSVSAVIRGGGGAAAPNGTSNANAWAQYYESYTNSTTNSGITTTFATPGFSNPLTVVFQTQAVTQPTVTKGDFGGNPDIDGGLNAQDTFVDGFDVDALILATNDPATWFGYNPSVPQATQAERDASLLALGDFGGNPDTGGGLNAPDGFFDGFDVDAFLLFINDPTQYAAVQPPPGSVSASVSSASVPESSALALFAPAALLASRRRR